MIKKRYIHILVSILFLSAIITRLLNCYFLPYFGDERVAYDTVRDFFAHLTLCANSYTSVYPPLLAILSIIPTGLWALLLYSLDFIQSFPDYAALQRVEPELCLLPGRLVAASSGILSLVFIYRLSSRPYGVPSAFFSTAIISLSTIHLYRSSTMQPDILGCLGGVLCLDYSLRFLASGKRSDIFKASIFAGVAAASKLTPGLIVVAIFSVHLFRLHIENRLTILTAILDKKIIGAGLFALLAFIIATPSWVFGIDRWLWLFKAIVCANNYVTGGKLADQDLFFTGWIYRWFDKDMWVVLLAGIGVSSLLYKHSRNEVVIFLSLIIPFMFFVLVIDNVRPYYFLFLYPNVALLGSSAYSLIENFFSSKKRIVFICSTYLFLLPLLLNTIHEPIRRLIKGDNRKDAYHWINSHINENASILTDFGYIPPILNRKKLESWMTGKHAPFFAEYFRRHPEKNKSFLTRKLSFGEIDLTSQLLNAEEDYLILSDKCYNRYFSLKPHPDNPVMQDAFVSIKSAYTAILNDPASLRWMKIQEFNTKPDAVITIYKRLE